MNPLQNFFIFCSGIDPDILQKCPSDNNKYIGIGATVFFTGILAFCSSAYALYTVFDQVWLAVGFGLIWGLMIFNLDRYIVSSMKSRGSRWRDFGTAFPRLLMAILLALVISKPLELKIFEKEINAELITMQQEVFKTQEDKIKVRYSQQIADNQTQIDLLKNELAEKTTRRDELALAAIQEADGTGGSMNKNLGPIYRAKKQEADAAQQELDALAAAHLPAISALEQTNAQLTGTIGAEISALDRDDFGGLAARMEALSRLGQQSDAILLASLFVTLLFIAIETAPIFVKLISSRSPYDYLLHEHEQVFEMANLEKTSLLKNKTVNTVLVDTKTGVHRANARVTADQAMIDIHLRERLEELKTGGPVRWDENFLNT